MKQVNDKTDSPLLDPRMENINIAFVKSIFSSAYLALIGFCFFGGIVISIAFQFLRGFNMQTFLNGTFGMGISFTIVMTIVLYFFLQRVLTLRIEAYEKVETLFNVAMEDFEDSNSDLDGDLLKPNNGSGRTLMLTNEQKEAFLIERTEQLQQLRRNQLDTGDRLLKLRQFFENETHPYVKKHYNDVVNRCVFNFHLYSKRKELVTLHNEFIDSTIKKYRQELAITKLGNDGEQKVKEEVEKISAYRVYSNLRIEYKGVSVEVDQLILSSKGIFFIETKNYGAKGQYGIRISKDGQWQRKLGNGSVQPMKDVVAQQNRQLYYLRQLINEGFQKRYGNTLDEEKVPFVPMIVMANENVFIENETSIKVIRTSHISHYVNEFHEDFHDRLLEVIAEILEENQLPLKEYPFEDYYETIEKRSLQLDQLDQEMEACYHSLHSVKQGLEQLKTLFGKISDEEYEKQAVKEKQENRSHASVLSDL